MEACDKIYIAMWGNNICGVYANERSAERRLRKIKAAFPLIRDDYSTQFWVHGPINIRRRGRTPDRKAWY